MSRGTKRNLAYVDYIESGTGFNGASTAGDGWPLDFQP